MRRIACVAVHELPLQLLLRDKPEWSASSVVVVSADRANGIVLYLNEAARAKGIAPGMRYGQALSLAHELRAGVVPVARCEQAVAELLALLAQFSPIVEPKDDEPGVLWLDGGGLGSLYSSASAWAASVHTALTQQAWQHAVMVGFGRFSCYAAAIARTNQSLGVFRTPEQASAFVQGIALTRLLRDPRECERLEQLGIRTLRDLIRLPAHSLRERVGPLAYGLRRLAGGDADAPLQAQRAREALTCQITLESVHEDRSSVLFRLSGLLPELLARAAQRNSAITAMVLTLRLDFGEAPPELRIETAGPTLDARVLLDLIRIKLEAQQLKAPLRGVALKLEDTQVKPGQESLLALRPRRDVRSANQALARLCTELGPDAVRQIILRDGHLPEASWGWQCLQALPVIHGGHAAELPPMVRRQHAPQRIRPPDPQELEGPVTLGGGWWNRALERRYYLRDLGHDSLSWVYFDAVRQQWFRQACVS